MDFTRKKIAILGLGEENAAVIRYLASRGAEITVCDQKSREELDRLLSPFESMNLNLNLGPDYLENLEKYDIIFRTPGLPYLHSKIQEAKKAGVEITSQIKLFFELCPSPILGVTGTKGKGTTTTLIGEILKISRKRVFVGGNIGTPPISFLNQLNKNDIVILELSSFQLQDLKKSPHIAVVLDIKIDHLDYHSGRNEYIEAKRMLVEHQSEKDFAVVNADYFTSFEFAASTPAKVYYFSRKKSVDLGAFISNDKIILRTEKDEHKIIDVSEIQLRGLHNLENICAAVTASFLAGASIDSIEKAISNFKGLEHRLEFVREINQVKYYNDSFSTTPDTTIAAVRSFSEPIILLVGGSEKNADYRELGEVINQSSVKKIIPIGQTASKIIETVSNSNIEVTGEIQSLDSALKIAKDCAHSGDAVLLSPASASFDRFKNYKDRGDTFKSVVGQL
jgi:UDP-N-acetylmuramoylalanine--D-glutamate ligase